MVENDQAVTVGLDVIQTARLSIPDGYAFRRDGSRIARLRAGLRAGPDALDAPCLAFVVRHPSAGSILVDTGLHPDAHTDPGADFGWPMRLLFRGLEPVGPPFDEQLRALGVEPGDVERVLMTHLHVDHTSGMRLLPNAKFFCTRREWAATGGRLAAMKGYRAGHLPDQDRMILVDLEADGEPHGALAHTIDLLGDGSIRLVSTPGHTRGHQSVLLHTAGDHDVLLVGDAAYTLRNVREGVLPMITDDDDASRESMRQLNEYAARASHTSLVPSHDPTAWHRVT